jgi:hypothetical protein
LKRTQCVSVRAPIPAFPRRGRRGGTWTDFDLLRRLDRISLLDEEAERDGLKIVAANDHTSFDWLDGVYHHSLKNERFAKQAGDPIA